MVDVEKKLNNIYSEIIEVLMKAIDLKIINSFKAFHMSDRIKVSFDIINKDIKEIKLQIENIKKSQEKQ